MKIERKFEQKLFKELMCGDVYIDSEGCFCMKIEDCGDINCCEICFGSVSYEEPDTKVELVNGKFVIEYE